MGHLRLDGEAGKWKIDLNHVSKHVTQLKKQLASCESVLEWIRTWNSCIGRFFSHTFGEPAPCFDVEYIDSILRTYQTMQESVFGSADIGVIQHVKAMLKERFNLETNDIPDAFIVLPGELGGLGVRNPFIPVLAVRGSVEKYGTTAEIMQEFFADEKKEYLDFQKSFNSQDESQRISNYYYVSGHARRRDDADEMLHKIMSSTELGKFMSFKEFNK